MISHRFIKDNFVRPSLVERSVAMKKICHVTYMKNIKINVQTAQTPVLDDFWRGICPSFVNMSIQEYAVNVSILPLSKSSITVKGLGVSPTFVGASAQRRTAPGNAIIVASSSNSKLSYLNKRA